MDLDLSKPLTPDQAKRLARKIIEADDELIIHPHAHERGEERAVTDVEIKSTIKGGVCAPAEWNNQHSEWRYRFETRRITVVVAFESDSQALVITVMRRK